MKKKVEFARISSNEISIEIRYMHGYIEKTEFIYLYENPAKIRWRSNEYRFNEGRISDFIRDYKEAENELIKDMKKENTIITENVNLFREWLKKHFNLQRLPSF